MSSTSVAPRRPVAVAILLIVTGAVGLFAAFNLVVDEFAKYENPQKVLTCDVSPFLNCSNVMTTWQGHLFGFPNPLLGMMGFVAPIAVGVALLAGFRGTKWFWVLFNAGLFLAWVFVTWLFTQTVWFIGYLCLWCMLVWAMTIPLFWVFTVWNLAKGNLPFGAGARRVGRALLPFCWAIPLANILFIIVTILVKFPLLLSTL
ncbi:MULTISPECIES: vitamin K epoxide reductase family protein [Curtobacterium]|uniref:vitamin K epoxide reductase family protein n=1 Tax=Curtobacterium TaxID=2034 RepID=UPI001C8EB15A|nr:MULTISPECIES: vitamin K epoxide reductase family protein [Curtobacterium]MBY0177081.1 vitamin K epoxide reductase family protein [Curtobacterium herbarum]MCP1501377.1 putative membrane protein [Curtobacterium herbarum]MDY1003548.1 vitamin K epoxide reductase family protein [Curtobacterium sp. CFBP9011]